MNMKLIVGLGNYGSKYLFTRHNVGFMAVDLFALQCGQSFKLEGRLKSEVCKFKKDGEDYILIKPQTYMNLSGEALLAVMQFYKIAAEDVLIIYDDIALDLGRMRFRPSGSDGGHNGIKSIIKVLGQNFNRLKLGIGPQVMASESYVLQNFSKEELTALKPILEKSIDAIECFYSQGMEKAQNLYN